MCIRDSQIVGHHFPVHGCRGSIHITGPAPILDADSPGKRLSLVIAEIQAAVLPQTVQHTRKILLSPDVEAVALSGLQHQAFKFRQSFFSITSAGYALSLGQLYIVTAFALKGGHKLFLVPAAKLQKIIVPALNDLRVLLEGLVRESCAAQGEYPVAVRLLYQWIRLQGVGMIVPGKLPYAPQQIPQHVHVPIIPYRAAGRV